MTPPRFTAARRLALAALAACFLAAPARADFDPAGWSYCKSVTLRDAEGTLGYVKIDPEVWAASAGGRLDHLRLVIRPQGGGDMLEVPSAVCPPAELADNLQARPQAEKLTAYSLLMPAGLDRSEEGRRTVLTADLVFENVPADRLRLSAAGLGPGVAGLRPGGAGANVRRAVRVLAANSTDQGAAWQPVAQATIVFGTTAARSSGESLSLRRCYARYLRVEIDNAAAAPLEALDVTIESLDRRLYFPLDLAGRRAATTGRLYLYYGNPAATAPAYDFSQDLARLTDEERAKALQARLGLQETNRLRRAPPAVAVTTAEPPLSNPPAPPPVEPPANPPAQQVGQPPANPPALQAASPTGNQPAPAPAEPRAGQPVPPAVAPAAGQPAAPAARPRADEPQAPLAALQERWPVFLAVFAAAIVFATVLVRGVREKRPKPARRK